MKHFTSYPLTTTNTKVNLPAILIMSELLIHSIIKQKKALDMQQFTSYPLTTNTEVNLLTALMVCELLIHSIIKEMKHEVRNSSQAIHQKQTLK